MPDLNDVNIKDLLAKSDEELRAALEAMLPKPYPEHLLGRWAKHPEHGDVLIGDDVPIESCVVVIVRDSEKAAGSSRKHVALSSLTFPEQTTRPEDVPVGEAWLVNVDDGTHRAERVVALKKDFDYWHTGERVVDSEEWWDSEVTLIAPLVPARPEPEPQLEHPRTLSSVEDYAAAPVGTVVESSDNGLWVKNSNELWMASWSGAHMTNSGMAVLEEQDVLRWGWGNE